MSSITKLTTIAWLFLFTSSAGAIAPVSGLVGDGVADESEAIQAAVDAGTGHLQFERGVYRLTKTIEVDLDRVGPTNLSGGGVARFVMEGQGPAFSFVGTHQGTADPKTVKPNVWQNQRAPMVDGIEIVGKHPQAEGIVASGTMQLTLTRLQIRNVLHAVRLTKRNRNVTLSECHLYDNRGIGVFLDAVNLHQINLANCHISYNRQGGVVAKGSEIRNLQIGTCDIEGNMSPQTQPTANVLLDATGSSLGEVAIVGCTIQHDHVSPDSANIRIDGRSLKRPFTDEVRHGNITISDNVLSDVAVNLDVVGVRALTVSGNTIWKGYQANVQLQDCRHVVFSGNVYDRNPRYHYGDGDEAKLGSVFRQCQHVTVTGDHFAGRTRHAAVLQLIDCAAINVSGCSFSQVSRVGISVSKVSFGQITGTLFSLQGESSVAIEMDPQSDVTESANRSRSVGLPPR